MPELPEVETMVRGIRSQVEGAHLSEFVRVRCRCRPLSIKPAYARIARLTQNTTITQVRRRAKRIILELSTHQAFVIEPRMTGLMLLSDPPDENHLRYEWRLVQKGRPRSLWFWDRRGLGTIRLVSAEELALLLGTTQLGPDALDITSVDWQQRLKGTSRPIKVALLDQRLVAGIGNLYASEILHRAGIDPCRRADRLTRKQIERLAAATRDILETAILYEGSTLSDGTYRNALNQSGSYQNAHRVYDREGESCPTCGGPPIVRLVQAQRSTFFCPACQS
jgi:formamidopyrimidine-DNA glycosylase